MKKYLLKSLILVSFLVGSDAMAQEISNNEIINYTNTVQQFDSRDKSLVGSSYINDKFMAAKISNDDKIYLIRYNTYQEQMEIEKDGKPYHLPKLSNYNITFQNPNKVYQVYTFPSNNKKGYFVQLFKGEKFNFLLKESIKFIEEQKPRTGYDKYKPPTLKRDKDKFFIGYKNFTTLEVPKKKKDFYALFSTNAKAVEKYVKSNKLSLKKQEDLIQIFKYYDTL